jgi:amidase
MLKPEAVYEVEQGLALSAVEISANSVIRSEWGRAVRDLFAQHDYWIVPTAQLFPFDVGARWPGRIAGQEMRTYHEWMKAVCLVTLSGCPSLAAPAGFSADGLPIGIQIVAPVHSELKCLQLAAAFEQANRSNVARLSPLLASI